jgi:hypothetical protein
MKLIKPADTTCSTECDAVASGLLTLIHQLVSAAKKRIKGVVRNQERCADEYGNRKTFLTQVKAGTFHKILNFVGNAL